MRPVLLAYERDQDLAAIETLLQSRGHRILKAHTGLEALELARQETPHAVVSDVLLPLLDGFSLCRRLKEDPALRHLPVFLLSFRIEGPKYEAFAAEVGAERFFPRGSTLEELAVALDAHKTGSDTMRIPALVPELLDKREQDRRHVAELERQVKELETTNRLLAVAERVARQKAEQGVRERADLAAADSAKIRELQARLQELEASQQQLSAAESQARGAVEESRAELSRIGVLESRLAEQQASRAAAQAASADAERLFRSHPVAALIWDMETQQVRAANDAAAAVLAISPESLPGRSLEDLLPGYEPGDDPSRVVDVAFAKPGGTPAALELRRVSVSYAGRACWLTTVRDVTLERAERAAQLTAVSRVSTLEEAPVGTCLVDSTGDIQYANAAFHALLGLDAGTAGGLSLQQFELGAGGESTIRSVAIGSSGQLTQETRWRRSDGSIFDVEVAATVVDGTGGNRVLSVRDVSARRRAQERADRESRRSIGLLELAQHAHSYTESEALSHALELVQKLTGSEAGYVFLATSDAGQYELAARRDGSAATHDLSVLTRWRGLPPADTALYDCLSSQRAVVRDGVEGTGGLRQAGLPGSLNRQLATPMLDGGRLAGVLLLVNKKEPFDEEDERHAAQVADVVSRLLRRRRSDAEVVSAMDHIERVMLGAVEAMGALSETQDGCKTGRARRVADLAAGIGMALGLPGHTVRGLRVMGQVIDVGMLQIPREILWRPGPLGAAEFELVKTHAERGHEILSRIEFPWPVAEAVRQHHERLDGSGYPRGLKGEEILLEARILAVADAVEAMLSPRPQRAVLSLAACIEELQSQAGRRYDARVVKACVKLLRERPSQPEAEVPVGQRIA
jgi:PAS domain S-box-containing protein